jgi:hypothetical protein
LTPPLALRSPLPARADGAATVAAAKWAEHR